MPFPLILLTPMSLTYSEALLFNLLDSQTVRICSGRGRKGGNRRGDRGVGWGVRVGYRGESRPGPEMLPEGLGRVLMPQKPV